MIHLSDTTNFRDKTGFHLVIIVLRNHADAIRERVFGETETSARIERFLSSIKCLWDTGSSDFTVL